jgi:hypothetical protein
MLFANEDHYQTLAAVHDDAVAIGRAALAGDFEEVRFRTQLITIAATNLQWHALAHAAAVLAATLGDDGEPLPGYGAAVLGLVRTIHAPAAGR